MRKTRRSKSAAVPQDGKTRPLALITGASSGIGATYAQRLAARGYDLILVARRADRLGNLARDLAQKHGIAAEPLPADLASDADCARVASRIRESANLEFLVNGAGFGSLRRFWNAELEVQDRMHRLHVLATMLLTHAALPGMIARKKGFLVNVSSVAAFMQYPGSVSYCATKAWMNSFTQGLNIELRGLGTGVRVQALCPGYTYT